jgi:putative addiction module component (TIGR02574 family)
MNDLADVFKLTPAERIQLAEDLWDSVAANPESLPPLTEAQNAEIEKRLAKYAESPSSASDWSATRARLWSRIG